MAAYDSAEIQQLEKIALGPNLVFLLRYIIMMSLVKRGCEIRANAATRLSSFTEFSIESFNICDVFPFQNSN